MVLEFKKLDVLHVRIAAGFMSASGSDSGIATLIGGRQAPALRGGQFLSFATALETVDSRPIFSQKKLLNNRFEINLFDGLAHCYEVTLAAGRDKIKAVAQNFVHPSLTFH
jgi:hypothetical protein